MLKSFTEVVDALLVLATSTRGWYGRLSQGDIARAMVTTGSAKSRAKRLWRFLRNARLKAEQMLGGLLGFTGVKFWGEIVPILIDQTSLCADMVQAVVASFPMGNRAIPVAVQTFQTQDAQGQNAHEWSLLQRLLNGLGSAIRYVLVMDRGYAKAAHMVQLLKLSAMFVIRGCRNIVVQYHDGKPCCRSLGRLRHRQGVAVRYRNVRYMAAWLLRVDIIVYRQRGFAEPWFLIVPPDSEQTMPTEQVVQWYRWRMRIEVTFRDFKSCMGVRRGLRFVVEPADKMARMLCCLAVAYTILLALSQTPPARAVRKDMEVRRRTARHGTRRTLSALSVAILTLIDAIFTTDGGLYRLLAALMGCWTHGVFSEGLDAMALT
jgi:hypothetical protein